MSGEIVESVIDTSEDPSDFCIRLNLCLICFTREVVEFTFANITCFKCKSTFCEACFLAKHSKIIDCHEFYC